MRERMKKNDIYNKCEQCIKNILMTNKNNLIKLTLYFIYKISLIYVKYKNVNNVYNNNLKIILTEEYE